MPPPQLWTVGKEAGFSAEPLKDNLFRWTITFFNFEKDTPLHKDVLEYKRSVCLSVRLSVRLLVGLSIGPVCLSICL